MSDQTGFDPKRRLCPDGTCTGVIGRDGRCTECRRTAGGSPGGAGGGAEASDDAGATAGDAWPDLNADGAQDTDGAGAGLSDAPAAAVAATATAGAGFDPNRRLCEDGACVGVVGPNGACTVCGRVAS